MATFGLTSAAGASDPGDDGDFDVLVSKWALSEDGDVSKLSAYFLGVPANTGPTKFKALIYADNGSNYPGALKGVGQEGSATANTTGWFDSTFASPVSLTAGTYWIGVWFGASAGAGPDLALDTGAASSWHYRNLGSSSDYDNGFARNPYDNPDDSNGAGSWITYATYTPTGGGTPQQLAATIAGQSAVSAALTDAKRIAAAIPGVSSVSVVTTDPKTLAAVVAGNGRVVTALTGGTDVITVVQDSPQTAVIYITTL